MDLKTLWSIVASIIISAGGIGAIIIGISKFLSERIAERIQVSYQLEIDKKFEEFKARIDQTKYIRQTYFDKELLAYQELCVKFNEMMETVNALFPPGLTLTSHYDNDDELLKNCNEKIHEAGVKYREANIALLAKAVFIPKEYYCRFDDLRKKVIGQIFDYNTYNPWAMKQGSSPEENQLRRDCFKRTKEINDQWDKLIDDLREYLMALGEQNEK